MKVLSLIAMPADLDCRGPWPIQSDGIDHASPISRGVLAEEADSRIPGSGFGIFHPAPVGYVRQQNPRGFGHGAGQMRNAGIGCDDQVECGDECGGVGQIAIAA